MCLISEHAHSMPRYITIEGGIYVMLTPDRIFSRMDAGRVYAARRAGADQTAVRPAEMKPALPQYAAPQHLQTPQYAQPLPVQLHQQYAQSQQYIPPQHSAPAACGFGMATEPHAQPAMPAAPENLSPAPTAHLEASQVQRPRSGTYGRLMASHDRMGTRHLG